MPYDRLTDRLAEGASPTVTTLPDGSVDHYCTVAGEPDGPIETREALAREVVGDRTSLGIRVEATEPGGQAVNAAKQLHALEGAVTCYGHLDAPVFDSLPFETVSMGDPSLVYILGFADRDLMLVRDESVTEWTLEDLRRVGDLSEAFGGDAVCGSNWAVLSGLAGAVDRLHAMDTPRVPFVFDPGDIVGSDPAAVEAVHETLDALQTAFDVVYNANRQEVRTTAAPLDGSFDDDLDRLAGVREATGITAVVMHARDEAAVATSDGRARVPNYEVAQPARHTGGGDRFSGGLAHALACGWDWDVALACGNACAVYYVGSGDTGTAADLRAFVEDRPEP